MDGPHEEGTLKRGRGREQIGRCSVVGGHRRSDRVQKIRQKGGNLFPDSLEIAVRSRKSCPPPVSAGKRGGMGGRGMDQTIEKDCEWCISCECFSPFLKMLFSFQKGHIFGDLNIKSIKE